MAQGRESNYRLRPSFIASTQSVLNPKIDYLKSFKHAIAFAFHPTDWRSRRVYSASNNRFIEHGFHKIKYPVLSNEIIRLEHKYITN